MLQRLRMDRATAQRWTTGKLGEAQRSKGCGECLHKDFFLIFLKEKGYQEIQHLPLGGVSLLASFSCVHALQQTEMNHPLLSLLLPFLSLFPSRFVFHFHFLCPVFSFPAVSPSLFVPLAVFSKVVPQVPRCPCYLKAVSCCYRLSRSCRLLYQLSSSVESGLSTFDSKVPETKTPDSQTIPQMILTNDYCTLF